MSNSKNYYILFDCGAKDSAVITKIPEETIKKTELNREKKLLHKLSEPLKLSFSKKYSDKIKLYDFVSNTLSLLIISDKIKNIFSSEKSGAMEFLPVQIYDLQNNIARYVLHC